MSSLENFDRVIIGGGIFGLYAASICAEKGIRTLVIEKESNLMSQASAVNQARVHLGYHYPRSITTAFKTIEYFKKFNTDFAFAINNSFEKIYGVARDFSWCTKEQFRVFCKSLNIRCDPINLDPIFNRDNVTGAYLTDEYSFDYRKIKSFLLAKIEKSKHVKIITNNYIESVMKDDNQFEILLSSLKKIRTTFVLNATYSGINSVNKLFSQPLLPLKYELCEMALCRAGKSLKNMGVTIIDGPFFSLMPYGFSGHHSLSAVSYTPHFSTTNTIPEFPCQKNNLNCSNIRLDNCNNCHAKPKTNWSSMYNLASKYMKEMPDIEYDKSIFAIKTILSTAEIDDSRPTLVRKSNSNPFFYTVLSGKINTLYDLNEIL